MKHAFAIATGAVVGFLLAGVLMPLVHFLLPSPLRGAPAVWSAAAALIVSTAAAFWFVASRIGRR